MGRGIHEKQDWKEQEEKLQGKKEGMRDEDGLRGGEKRWTAWRRRERRRKWKGKKEEKEDRNKDIKICSFMLFQLLNCSEILYSIKYVGVLISLWLFPFAAQQKEFFLDGLKELEQWSHKHVELRGEYVK
jgi:hypothetical protein